VDLSVSPDLDAYFCYVLVLALGLVTAYGQISRRLTNLPSKWIMVNTWLLFFSYTLLPVALFWFLDRTGAIHDTSLFAAILVGAGYQRILSGELASIRPAGDIAKFWQPFVAWSDHVADRIRNRILRNDALFDERLFSDVRADKAKQESLQDLAFTHTKDLPKLKAALKQVDDDKASLGDAGVLTKTVRLLYDDLKDSAPETWQYLLHKNGIISKGSYEWYGKEWRSKTTAALIASILLIAAGVAVIKSWTPDNRGRYYIWRIAKTNNTDADRFRSARHLMDCLQETKSPYPDLAELLRTQGLSVRTAETVLSLLVESRNISSNLQPSVPELLADSLRTDNPDIRARINDVLLYLAGERNIDVGNLKDWKPSAKDSVNEIDAKINLWKHLK
jgi:hypothetical protein